MTAFLHLVEFLVAIGLLTTLVGNYLIINKLWTRRATREVAESISIVAALMGLGTAIPFLIHFLLVEQSVAGALKTAIGIATGCAFVAIGSGIWVPELRRLGFRRLLMRALKLEKKESTHLLKQFVQPKGADRIIKILTDLASVDGHVDEKEEALIRDFAREWHLEEPELERAPKHVDILDLRESVQRYLEVGPPARQAGQLLDLLHLLAEADDRVTWQEAVALEEVEGLLHHYVTGEGAALPAHEVLIVPQSDEQVEAVRSLLPDREEKELRGGKVFSVGRFFSERYAEVVCQKYISIGLFTTMVSEGQEGGDLPSPPGPAEG